MDEPEPVAGFSSPNVLKVLAAAVRNCLSASLLLCLQRAKAEVGGIEVKVSDVFPCGANCATCPAYESCPGYPATVHYRR